MKRSNRTTKSRKCKRKCSAEPEKKWRKSFLTINSKRLELTQVISSSLPIHRNKPKSTRLSALPLSRRKWTRLLCRWWKRSYEITLTLLYSATRSTLSTSSWTPHLTCSYLAWNRCNPPNSPSFIANWRSNFTQTRIVIPKQRRHSNGFNLLWTKPSNQQESEWRTVECKGSLSTSERSFFPHSDFLLMGLKAPPLLSWIARTISTNQAFKDQTTTPEH